MATSPSEMTELEREIMVTKIRKEVEAQFWDRMKWRITSSTVIIAVTLAAFGLTTPILLNGMVERWVQDRLAGKQAVIDGFVERQVELKLKTKELHQQFEIFEKDAGDLQTRFNTNSARQNDLDRKLESLVADFKAIDGTSPEELAKRLEVFKALTDSDSNDLVKQFETILNQRDAKFIGPAACYKQIAYQNVAFGKPSYGGTVINFSHKLYDTDDAVTPGERWHFKSPKDGIYNVAAFTACQQAGGRLVVGLCKNQEPGTNLPDVYLAQDTDYKSGRMIGGATDIELEEGANIDIRVYSAGVSDSKIMAVGTTHVSIHYVRPSSIK